MCVQAFYSFELAEVGCTFDGTYSTIITKDSSTNIAVKKIYTGPSCGGNLVSVEYMELAPSCSSSGPMGGFIQVLYNGSSSSNSAMSVGISGIAIILSALIGFIYM